MAQSGHLGQFAALSCHIWQLDVHTLSQRLRCFPAESRAEIFPQHIQDCPLPLPINRTSFEDLWGEKRTHKVGRKSAITAQFSCNQPLFLFPSPPLALINHHHHHSFSHRHLHLKKPLKRYTQWLHHLLPRRSSIIEEKAATRASAPRRRRTKPSPPATTIFLVDNSTVGSRRRKGKQRRT